MNPLRTVSLVLSALAMVAGGLGMAMSFLYLASRSMEDITAGTSGFAAGLISLAILSAKAPDDFPRQSSTFGRQTGTGITA